MKPLALTFFLFLACVYLLAHFFIMVEPDNLFYARISCFDKVEHFISGFVLAGLIASTVKHERAWQIVLASVFMLGLLFEFVEAQTVYGGDRLDTLTDLCCNMLGAVFGMLTAWYFHG